LFPRHIYNHHPAGDLREDQICYDIFAASLAHQYMVYPPATNIEILETGLEPYYTRNNKNGKNYASGTEKYIESIAHGKFTSAANLSINKQ
jgi:hypothetical protein